MQRRSRRAAKVEIVLDSQVRSMGVFSAIVVGINPPRRQIEELLSERAAQTEHWLTTHTSQSKGDN
jgi:hypothetical protein